MKEQYEGNAIAELHDIKLECKRLIIYIESIEKDNVLLNEYLSSILLSIDNNIGRSRNVLTYMMNQ